MEIRDLVRVLINGYKIIAAMIFVCLLPAIATIAFQAPEYTALTRIYVDVRTPADASTYELGEANRIAQIRTITFKGLIPTSLVLDGVARNLSLSLSPDELASHVTAQSSLDTSIIDISVAWPHPEMAATIANEVADEAIAVLGSHTNESSRLTLVQAQPAIVPEGSSSPNPIFYLGLAGFAGLLLGAASVLIRQGLQRRILFPDQLSVFSEVPVLAVLSRNSLQEIQGLTGTILSVKRFEAVRTIAVVSPLGHVMQSDITRDLSNAFATATEGHTVIGYRAKLARQEPIPEPQNLDIALLAIARGQDTYMSVEAAIKELQLLGVKVGGMILFTPRRRGLRPRDGFIDHDVQ